MTMQTTTPRPRKILMTADAIGGVWSYALELCAGVAGNNVEVVLATMGPQPTRAQREAVARMPHVQLKSTELRLEWMTEPWDDVELAGEWLLDLAEAHEPDLVHLNGYVHAALPWRMPTLVVAHSCVWSWWRAVHGSDPPSEWNRYRDEVARGLLAADAIAAPSAAMLRSLQTYADVEAGRGLDLSKGHVIYNGRDLFAAHAAGQRAPLVFAAGRAWDEAKNIRVLDRAARELAWPVYVAGDTIAPHGSEVELSHARALGPLSYGEVQQWLSRASIYALPALYEPFGLSVLEAAMQGCALVLGDIPSLREIWGDAAVYVPPRDAAALGAALSWLIDDPTLIAQYADSARRRAHRYSRAAMVAGYEALYAPMLPQRLLDTGAQSTRRQALR